MNPHQAIGLVIERYCEGLFTGDVAMLREITHEDAKLVGFAPASPQDSELPDVPLIISRDAWLERVARRASPQSRGETRNFALLGLDITGPIAIARVHCPMLGYRYLDYLSLVHTGGKWLIMHKQYVHLAALH